MARKNNRLEIDKKAQAVRGKWVDGLPIKQQSVEVKEQMNELITVCEPFVRTIARNYMQDKNPGLIEDSVQRALMNITVGFHHYNANARFTPYLATVTDRACIDELRKNKRHSRNISLNSTVVVKDDELPASWEVDMWSTRHTPQDIAIYRELKGVLEDAKGTLSPKMRRTFEEIIEQEKKYSESADSQEVPVGTIKSRVSAAKKRIANELEERNYPVDGRLR